MNAKPTPAPAGSASLPRAASAWCRTGPGRRAGRFLLNLMVGGGALAIAGAAVDPDVTPSPPSHPNVLFIAIDDLNHWIGHLGRYAQVRTPHLDRLAGRGVSFSRAYCVAPACNPSRTALMTGLRPSTTGVYHNPDDWRPLVDDALTLNAHFRRHGYTVLGAGKIYHGGFPSREWDGYLTQRKDAPPVREGEHRGSIGPIRWNALESGDQSMNDYHVVSWSIRQLERSHANPFFLACGIFRPHLPWAVPRQYFELYPEAEILLPPYREDDLEDIPQAGRRMAGEALHDRIVAAGAWKTAIRAYLASISFADAQLGRLLDALDTSAYRDNTVIVLWGDHGWHLGEKHHWRKFTLWEEATRAPLMWVVPNLTPAGAVCGRTVDFLSIFPTLTDLCGLPTPSHVEGVSLRPLLTDPESAWPRPALTTHGYRNHAVRSETWRYIRYADGEEELYDEVHDPYEWTNQADRPELAGVKAALTQWLPATDTPPSRRPPE